MTRTHTKSPARLLGRHPGVDSFTVGKLDYARHRAAATGLIGRKIDRVKISARLGKKLLAVAKKRTGIATDSALIEAAVTQLVFAEDFGTWLIAQRGRLARDFTLDV
jgi:hypothetical protein